MASIGESLRKH